MSRLVLWLGFVALVFAAGCNLLDPNPGPDPLDAPPPADPVSAAFGMQVFAQRCERCHGPEGSGGTIYPDPIIGCDSVAVITREGRGAMPAFPDLSDNARTSIQQYLDSLAVVFNLDCPD